MIPIILHSREVPEATLKFCRELFAPSVGLDVRTALYRQEDESDDEAASGFRVKLRHHTFAVEAVGVTLQATVIAVYWSWRRWLGSDEYLEIAIPAVITGVHDLVVPKQIGQGFDDETERFSDDRYPRR
jgi:hypothetical protein